MADPFSLTANAVGVTSLGITVCQGLINYCQAFAGQYRDVRLAVQDLRDLEKSLTSLRSTLTLISLHRPELFNLVTPYIDTLKSRVEELQPILSKFRKNVSGEASFKDKAKSATQRAFYPFKKEMIRELRDTVRQAQDNLILALGVVQVDLLTDVASFQGDISTLVQQSAIALISLSAARQDVRQMESGLIGRLDSVLLQLQKMAIESKQIYGTGVSSGISAIWPVPSQSITEKITLSWKEH